MLADGSVQGISAGFLAFVILPGAMSIAVHRMILPGFQAPLGQNVLEALVYGAFNFAILFTLGLAAPPSGAIPVLLSAVFVLVTPCIWPFVLRFGLEALQHRRLIPSQSRTGWDHVFRSNTPYFVIVHLHDGRRIGGFYGARSYAGVFAASGHLFLEEVWDLNEDGDFVDPVPDSEGIVLRPTDYHFVELKTAAFEPEGE